MFGPGWKQGCPSCSFMADHSDGMTAHLAHRDVTLVAVSRAPLPDIERFRQRMGWQFKWVSSHGSDFNYDRSEEHTSELQSLMRLSYAVFCMKQKTYSPSIQPTKLLYISTTDR